MGDLPEAPGRSKYDFVLRSADAAIWVTSLRPRGRDFELSLDTRVDTGRWIEVSGTLQQGHGLQWLHAEGSRVALASAPKVSETSVESIPVPAARPLEVVFSAPTQDETDVLQTSPVRIQFSRDIDPSTLKDRVRVTYLAEEARIRGEPDTPVAMFTVQYLPATRVLEIRFTEPLVRYRTIKVDLLEGIRGVDKQPLAPWTLEFRHRWGGVVRVLRVLEVVIQSAGGTLAGTSEPRTRAVLQVSPRIGPCARRDAMRSRTRAMS